MLASLIFPLDPEALTTLKACIGVVDPVGRGTVIEGLHAEGPCIRDLGGLVTLDNEMKIRQFDDLMMSTLGGPKMLKVMTIAPSVESVFDPPYGRISRLRETGVTVSLGHDKHATAEEVIGAIAAVSGDREDCTSASQSCHFTHLFNVGQLHHREVGTSNVGLLNLCDLPNLEPYESMRIKKDWTVELIGDLIHVHPLALTLALRGKNNDNIAFISDSIIEDKVGTVKFYGGRQIEVNQKRQCCLRGTSTIAGSCVGQFEAFVHLLTVFRCSLLSAVKMMSSNPARIARISDRVGTLLPGRRADFLILSSSATTLQQTFIAGVCVYNNKDTTSGEKM